MKLLHYTNRNLSILLFFLMGIWGLFFYLTIIEEVMDETDDTLENYRAIIVDRILMDSTMLYAQDNVLHSYTITPLTDADAQGYQDRFYDSTVYIETEDEQEPVRVMKSCFRTSDGNFYELELHISTLERDNMVRAIFWYLIILYIILLVCTMLGTRLVLRRVFVPFDRLLAWLDEVTPGRAVPQLRNETRITEFKRLNQAAVAMSQRSERAYQEQKTFIENASHELQTPLAIAQGKLELLVQSEGLTKEQLTHIDGLYQTLGRVVKLNKSLLLLSRINNGQYPHSSQININQMLHEVLDNLMDIYQYKQIKLSINEEAQCVICMNESLANVLLVNLLKNALTHSDQGSRVDITITGKKLTISNSGDKALDTDKIFHRFYRADMDSKESTGLGLSIVKSIADLYGIELAYHYENSHIFALKFMK